MPHEISITSHGLAVVSVRGTDCREVFAGEPVELRAIGHGIESIDVPESAGKAVLDGNGNTITVSRLGRHRLVAHFVGAAKRDVNLFVCERECLDAFSDVQSGSSSLRSFQDKCESLRAVCNGAPWFDGTRASLANRSIAEFGG